ncbi:MAG: hypothetical protein ACR2RL_18725 [Gammaproteobacteria bacterium]
MGLPADRYYVDSDTAHEELARRGQFNVIDLATGWKADLIVCRPREFSLEKFRRRTAAHVQGVDAHVASAEDTDLSELEWAAMGESDRQLSDAAGVISVHGGSLDMENIERWVEELGLEAERHRALRLARGS